MESKFERFMRDMLAVIENDEDCDELTRARAALSRRHSDARTAINTILLFSDPHNDSVSLETVNAANAILESALTAFAAFLAENPIP